MALETKIIEKRNVSKELIETESQPVNGKTRDGGTRKEYLKDANSCKAPCSFHTVCKYALSRTNDH